MGYRWYDHHQVEPAYPFGHGLSYTSFEYGEIQFNSDGPYLNVINTGDAKGKEVIQLYIGFPEGYGEPPKLLKGFSKVELAPNESKFVAFNVTQRDLSFWDVESHGWQEATGTFSFLIGSSSRDIRASAQSAYPFVDIEFIQ